MPARAGGREILEIHSRGMPLAADVDIPHLAAITHGFVGADLEALCREAAMLCLRRLLPAIDFSSGQIPYETLRSLEVRMADFEAALCEVEPSAIREVFVEVPDVGWDDVGGLEAVKDRLIESVEWPLKYADLFTRVGVRPPKGILLTGPPGCGKTLLAKAVASQTQVNFISVKGPSLLSKWVGESERGVREIFRKAKQAAPCIVFFDEIDTLVPTRGSGGDSQVTERVIGQFLAEVDGVEELNGVLILGATNRPDILDPAIMRPGRFDLQLEIPLPDLAGRIEIFRIGLRGKPLAKDVAIPPLAEKTEGFNGAEIQSICTRAAWTAIREALAKPQNGAGEAEIRLTAKHLFAALDELSLTPRR
jgi:transitional endoplasmic reticulum ATPase